MSPNWRTIGLLVVASAWGQPYTVTRIAGGAPPPAGIEAVKAALGGVGAVAVDRAGRIHLAAHYCLFRIEANGILTRIAGTGTLGYSMPGRPALDSRLGYASSIVFDAKGKLYYSDWGEIRSIDSAGLVELVAPMQAQSEISSLAIDAAGNLYAAYPQDHRVRRITPAGVVSVVA